MQDASTYSLDAALNGYTLLEGRTLGDVPHGAPPHDAFNNFVDITFPIDQVRFDLRRMRRARNATLPVTSCGPNMARDRL